MKPVNDHSARAHALLSASASERWMACPASAKLAEQYPKQDTPFTREGTYAHEIAEHMASGEDAKSLDETFLQRVTDEGFDPAEMVRHATAYRDYIDSLCGPDTTKMLEVRVDFSPWVPEGFGTADCILLTGNVMDVIDYKYGAGVEVSAVGNPQMQLYGLGAFNDYGFVYDVSVIRLHIFQPRKDNVSTWEISIDQLLQFGKFASDRARAAMEGTDMNAGNHCKFCPHSGHCATLAYSCLRFCTEGPNLMPETLSPEATAALLKMEPMLSAWLKKIKDQARTDMLNGTDIPGFKIVEGKQGNRKWTDESAVAHALEAAGFGPSEYTETVLLSPAAMDKAIGKKKAAELLSDMIIREPGTPTVVPSSDKRPKLDRLSQAKEDFAEV